MAAVRPKLRALSKLPTLGRVKLPSASDLPAGSTWGGLHAPKGGYERFFNANIRSMLTLPSRWHSYEFQQDFGNGIIAQNALSSVEDVNEIGFFDTGVTFTLLKTQDPKTASTIAEVLRQATLKEISTKLGGFEEWVECGETAQICSLRYVANAPAMKLNNAAASTIVPEKTMLYIQNLFLEKSNGFVFVSKFECPKEAFHDTKTIFETIQTGGFYLLDDNGANGFALTEL
jgi:hypothetical protein